MVCDTRLQPEFGLLIDDLAVTFSSIKEMATSRLGSAATIFGLGNSRLSVKSERISRSVLRFSQTGSRRFEPAKPIRDNSVNKSCPVLASLALIARSPFDGDSAVVGIRHGRFHSGQSSDSPRRYMYPALRATSLVAIFGGTCNIQARAILDYADFYPSPES